MRFPTFHPTTGITTAYRSEPRRMNEELQRLNEDEYRRRNWKRWRPYLSERQWATVREDYSERGDTWCHCRSENPVKSPV
jgi:hypothetical protein